MACPDPGDLLDLSLSRLPAPAAKAAAAHAAVCSACGRELASLKGTLSAVRSVPPAAPSAGFLHRVRREVEVIRRAEREAEAAEHLIRSRPWWRRPWIPAAAAAALLAAVSGGLWWSLAPPRPLPPSARPGPSPGPRFAERAPLPAPEPELPVGVEGVDATEPPEPDPEPAFLPDPTIEPPRLPEPEPEPSVAPATTPVDTQRPWNAPAPVLPRTRSIPEAGRAWLASSQNPDGSWGELAAEENLASRLQVASLAVLAMTEGGTDPTCTSALAQALGFLVAHQDAKGRIGPPCDKAALVQAMATAALAAGTRHDGALKEPLRRSVRALLSSRSQGGWARDGGKGPVHAVATGWAAAALRRSRAADPTTPEDWKAKASAACARLVDRRTGEADEWASSVAAGSVLSGTRAPEARGLADAALRGLGQRLASPTMDGADPETLALLALWARADPKTFPALGEELRKALVRWAPDPSSGDPWRARKASPWDGLSGDAWATALGTWISALR